LISDSFLAPFDFVCETLKVSFANPFAFAGGQNLQGLYKRGKIKTALREGGLFWLTYTWVSAHVAFAIPSSKQKGPDLLGEKQASDGGYAATQISRTYWAVFYPKSDMCQ